MTTHPVDDSRALSALGLPEMRLRVARAMWGGTQPPWEQARAIDREHYLMLAERAIFARETFASNDEQHLVLATKGPVMSEDRPQFEYQKHDPIERAADGEPHFILLARDPLAADLVRYYGAARAHNTLQMDALHKRIVERMKQRPMNFDKDRAHQRSAQAVAINMELWAEEERIKQEGIRHDQ